MVNFIFIANCDLFLRFSSFLYSARAHVFLFIFIIFYIIFVFIFTQYSLSGRLTYRFFYVIIISKYVKGGWEYVVFDCQKSVCNYYGACFAFIFISFAPSWRIRRTRSLLFGEQMYSVPCLERPVFSSRHFVFLPIMCRRGTDSNHLLSFQFLS